MDDHLRRYADDRTRREKALSYSKKYEREWHKRVSDSVERRVLARALRLSGAPHDRVLDMPCGAGRLTRELAPHAQRLYAADYSIEQVRLCVRSNPALDVRPLRVNCFRLPFSDRTLDLVHSVRLSHHIGSEEDRVRYLRELLRVSRKSVIVTFFDRDSLKNRLREVRRLLRSKKRAKYTMSLRRIEQIAADEGFELVAALPLSRFFSGHRFCVFRRLSAAAADTA